MVVPRFVSALALAAMVAAPLGAFAQAAPVTQPAPPAGAPHHKHHKHHGNAFMRSLHGLTLSDQQKQHIRDLAKSTRAANQGADKATRKANMEKMHDGVLGILTPDQRTQFQTNMSREKARATKPQ